MSEELRQFVLERLHQVLPRLALDAEFDESKVKRDHGKFTSQGGAGASAEVPKVSRETPPKSEGSGSKPKDDFAALLARSRADTDARAAKAAKIVSAGGSVKLTSTRRPEHSALVGPDMSEPGKFRITRFDEQGPFGHTVYSTYKEAVTDALREGYEPKSEESGTRSAPKGEHPGHGYSSEAELRDGVIHTTNVNDAVRALYEDRKVSLKQPRQVSTLVSKLSDIAKRMERLGSKAPNFDLCNVSVEGTNLFCAESKGIPRAKMPQIPTAQVQAFRDFLKDKGFTSEEAEAPVAYLKATQDELVGAKVSSMMKRLKDRDPSEDSPLFVSSDDYIMDGHHRWAARVGLDAGGDLGKTKVKVIQINLGIIDLLEQAETFTGGKGHKEAKAEARDQALDAAPIPSELLQRVTNGLMHLAGGQ